MSVVAIKRISRNQFEIAADSIHVRGWTQGKDPSGKLWRIGDLVAGTAGKMSLGGLFREYIENHKPKTNNEWGWLNFMQEFIKQCMTIDTRYSFDDNDFIVIWKERAFELAGGLNVKPVKKFAAIGAGSDFALAALHLGHSAKKACEIACELSVLCERPVRSIKV